MEQRLGTRAKPARGPGNATLFAGLRTIGFFLLVAAGMAILSAVVLVPAWAESLQAEYLRDCGKADLIDTQELLAAYTRKIRVIETDPQLTRRLAWSILGRDPAGKAILLPGDTADFTPGAIQVTPSPRPDPPSGWQIVLDQKVQDLPTRRGLLLLAAGAIICAVYLFDPTGRRVRGGKPVAGSR